MTDNNGAKMLRVGVAIDRWKLGIFKRWLDKAGYSYEEGAFPSTDPELRRSSMMIYVRTRDPKLLEETIRSAQAECAEVRPKP